MFKLLGDGKITEENPGNLIQESKRPADLFIPEFVTGILFGLVIGVGFLVFQDQVGFFFSFRLVLFVTTYYIIIYDWIAYNNLLKEFPYAGHLGRFILDLTIFFIFFLLFISVSNFERYILILPFFFFMVPIWDQLALRQYKDRTEEEKKKLRIGRKIGLFFFSTFFALAIAYRFTVIRNYEVIRWIIVVLVWISFSLLLARFRPKP